MKIIVLNFVFLFLAISIHAQNNIFDIARNGNSKDLTTYLENHKIDLNIKNDHGFTPLILACYHGNIEIATVLINKGINLNILSEMGTAITAATYKGNIKIVELLLNHNADTNIADKKGTTALHYACIFNNIELTRLILTKKTRIDSKDEYGMTALDYAIKNNNIELIKLFKNHE